MANQEWRKPANRNQDHYAAFATARRGFASGELFVVMAMIGLLAAILFPLFARARDNARRRACQNNLKQLGLGFHQYTQDYEGRFPPAKIGGVRPVKPGTQRSLKPLVGWMDALYPYTKSGTLNYCPASPKPLSGNANSPNATAYWFNGNLSAVPTKRLKNPATTLLCGDGNDGNEVADGTYNKTALPASWRSDQTLPSYRHLGGANYAFADGHVKWLKPDVVSTTPGAAYSFSTK